MRRSREDRRLVATRILLANLNTVDFSQFLGVILQGSIENRLEVRRSGSCIRSRGHASGTMGEISDVRRDDSSLGHVHIEMENDGRLGIRMLVLLCSIALPMYPNRKSKIETGTFPFYVEKEKY
jgi:hypothetical protein